MRQLQHFADMFRNVTKFQIAMHLARAGEGAYDGSQTTAVDEHHLAEMQHDRTPVAQQMRDVVTQAFRLRAGYDSSLAAHDGDSSHIAGFQYHSQFVSRRNRAQRATALRTTVLRSSPVMSRSKRRSSW